MSRDFDDNEENFLKETAKPGAFKPWQEVELEVYEFTDLGMVVSINEEYSGLVFQEDMFAEYYEGQELTGYIKQIREDGKIDVTLQPQKRKHVRSVTDNILQYLEDNGGQSHLNDKSSPEEIKRELGISKKVFKQSIGRLYKLKKVELTERGIELVKLTPKSAPNSAPNSANRTKLKSGPKAKR